MVRQTRNLFHSGAQMMFITRTSLDANKLLLQTLSTRAPHPHPPPGLVVTRVLTTTPTTTRNLVISQGTDPFVSQGTKNKDETAPKGLFLYRRKTCKK